MQIRTNLFCLYWKDLIGELLHSWFCILLLVHAFSLRKMVLFICRATLDMDDVKQLCIIFRDVKQIDSEKITNQRENEPSNFI